MENRNNKNNVIQQWGVILEIDIYNTNIGKDILNNIEEERQEENELKLRVELLKGKSFLIGVKVFIQHHPIFYDNTNAWWSWDYNTNSWEETNITDIINKFRKELRLLGDTTIKHTSKIIEAFKQASRENIPEEPPQNYIQFGKQFIDINTKQTLLSTPKYFSTNSIPWNIGDSEETPIMDQLITEWVGEEYKLTVYQLLCYCTYRGYPVHRIFCLLGTGANGKTSLLKIIEKFIGQKNKSSVTLKKISGNDFALFPLYKKLVCFIGETSHEKLDSTEILKALSGEDPVSFEAKGRNGFTGTNYAKLIVGTNTLPPSMDTSRGWDRRWLIIKFPNEYTEGRNIMAEIPDTEYNNLARKTLRILPELFAKNPLEFDNEGSIDKRKETYKENSNPITTFINTFYERDADSKVRYQECYLEYLNFLAKKKMRRVDKKEFSGILEDEGLETQRTSMRDPITSEIISYTVIWGIKKKPVQTTINSVCAVSAVCRTLPVASYSPLKENRSELENREYCAYKTYEGDFVSKEGVFDLISTGNNIKDNIADGNICITYDMLLSIYPNMNTEVNKWLDELKAEGRIFEMPSNHYRVLK